MPLVVSCLIAAHAVVFWALFGHAHAALLMCFLSSAWFIDATYLFKATFEMVRAALWSGATDPFSSEGTSVNLRVWPMDIDFWNHMNNARYARKFEWGRAHFLQRAGLREALLSFPVAGNGKASKQRVGVHFGFGALAIRYRREVKLFTAIRTVTRLVAWDRKCFYFSQRMLTRSGAGGQEFVNAFCLSKITIARSEDCTAAQVLRHLQTRHAAVGAPPGGSGSGGTVPEEYIAPGFEEAVRGFMTFESASSALLRRQA